MENESKISSYVEETLGNFVSSPVEGAKKIIEDIKKDPTMLKDIKLDLIARGNKPPSVVTGYFIDQVLKAESYGVDNYNVSNFSFANYKKDPLLAKTVIIKDMLANRVGVANSFNIAAKYLDQISSNDTDFLNETIKELKERIELSGETIDGRVVPLLGTPYENEEILKNLDNYTKGKRLSNDRDIVDEVLTNPKIRTEDKPQAIIDVLKGRKKEDYQNSLSSLTEHLFESKIDYKISAFVIKEVLKADSVGLDNYKKSPFEAVLANDNPKEIAHFIISKLHAKNTQSLSENSNLLLDYVDKVAINNPGALSDVKIELKSILKYHGVKLGDKNLIESLEKDINEHEVGMRRDSLERNVHSIMDDITLCSQEKMSAIQQELKYSSARGTYNEDLEKVMNTAFEHRDFKLSKFIIQQVYKLDEEGVFEYKANGIDFINFNNDANESAHFIVSKGIEQEKNGPKAMFNEMAKLLDQIKEDSFFKDTISNVKEKLGKKYESISEKFNGYVKGFREEENMAKNLVNFVKGLGKDKKEPEKTNKLKM